MYTQKMNQNIFLFLFGVFFHYFGSAFPLLEVPVILDQRTLPPWYSILHLTTNKQHLNV